MCLKVNILGRIPKQWQGGLGEHRELELGLPYPEAVDFLGHFTQLLRWLPTKRNSGALGNSLMVDPCLSHTAHSAPSPLLRFLSQRVTLHPNPWGYAGLGRTQTKQKKLAFRNDSTPTMIKWKRPFSMVAWRGLWSGGKQTDCEGNTACSERFYLINLLSSNYTAFLIRVLELGCVTSLPLCMCVQIL